MEIGEELFGNIRNNKDDEGNVFHALVTGYFVKPVNGRTEVDICTHINTDKEGTGIFDDMNTVIEDFYGEEEDGKDFMVVVTGRFGNVIDGEDVEVEFDIVEITNMNGLKDAMEKMKREPLVYGFVVEGVNEKDKINRLVERSWEVVIGGELVTKEVEEEVGEMIRGVDKAFILTTPNKVGEELAKELRTRYPILERIELNPRDCRNLSTPKTKIGVEYASDEYLRDVLRQCVSDEVDLKENR